MITSKITSKAQTTIPLSVRQILGVGPGDNLVYEVDGDRIILSRAQPDASELAAMETLLSEWTDPANNVYDRL